MTGPLEVLLVEDDQAFARMVRASLPSEAGIRLTHAGALAEAVAPAPATWDAVLLDLGLPDSDGLDTFRRLSEVFPRAAVVIVSGASDREMALQAVRSGAQDFLLKGSLSGEGIARAVLHAVERKRLEVERDQLIVRLREALASVRQLQDLLPICAQCKKIKDDRGYWHSVESYVAAHTGVMFSHGLCHECLPKLFPEVDLADLEKG